MDEDKRVAQLEHLEPSEPQTADFSPLPFPQCWLGKLSPDGNTIHGRWETSRDGRDWELDFELDCQRL